MVIPAGVTCLLAFVALIIIGLTGDGLCLHRSHAAEETVIDTTQHRGPDCSTRAA
jgi:hypothetical protein